MPHTAITGGYYAGLSLWAAIVFGVAGRWSGIKLNVIDVLVAVVLALTVISLVSFGYIDSRKLLGFTLFFVAVPYVLARMLDTEQLRQLLLASIAMGWLMFLWIMAWLAFANTAGNYGARPHLFGFSHTPLLAGLLFGSVVVLLISVLARPFQRSAYNVVSIASLIATLPLFWALQVVGARGGFILTSFIALLILLAARWIPFGRRLVIVLFLAVFAVVSFKMLPAKQTRFFARLGADVDVPSSLSAADDFGSFSLNDSKEREKRRLAPVSKVCRQIDWMQYHGRSGEVRKLLYGSAVRMFLEHPWMGVGSGRFGYTLCMDGRFFPHSTILQIFAELGLLGGLPFMTIIALLCWQMAKVLSMTFSPRTLTTFWMFVPLWGFYLLTDQLYGDYMMALPFFLLTGAGVALVGEAYREGNEVKAASNRYPKISVITPSYNQAEFLERTIRSVVDQQYPNLEYIIIDGGSTDSSMDVIKAYAHKIHYWVSEKDNGQAAAINKGLRIATGEWVAWQNSDDVFYPGSFDAVMEVINENPDADVITGNIKLIDEKDNVIRDIKYARPSYNAMLAEGMVLTNQAAFWRSNLHKKIGLLDESLDYAFDYEWFLRLIRGRKVVHLNRTLGGYRLHEQTKTNMHANQFTIENMSILRGRRKGLWFKRIYQLRRLVLLLGQGNYWYIMRGMVRRLGLRLRGNT